MAKQSVCSGQHTPDRRLLRQYQLVDYTVAITEVGYKAQMMNAFFNIKTVTVWNQKMQKYVDWEKYQDCDQQ